MRTGRLSTKFGDVQKVPSANIRTYPWKGACFVNQTQDLSTCSNTSATVLTMKRMCNRCMRGPKQSKKKMVNKCRSHWLGLGTYFKSASAMTSTKAQAYCTWIYWIIMKNMPLTLVEDTHHSNFSHFKTKISYKSLLANWWSW
jgi:hypothetical protein